MKAKIDREGLRRIYQLRLEGLPQSIIAERLGISPSLVREVLGGRAAICQKEKAPEVSQPGPYEESQPSLA